MVINSRRNPLQARRRLRRRLDRTTGGQERTLLRTITAPGRCTMHELQRAIGQWDSYVSRREQEIWSTLKNELKLAGLEPLVPEELERHLMLNATGLSTHEAARLEVVTYTEAMTGLGILDKHRRKLLDPMPHPKIPRKSAHCRKDRNPVEASFFCVEVLTTPETARTARKVEESRARNDRKECPITSKRKATERENQDPRQE